MKITLCVCLVMLSHFVFSQKMRPFYLGASLGYVQTARNEVEKETLINPSNESTVSGNLALGYTYPKNFGVLLTANFADYSLDSLSYYSFVQNEYPGYFILSQKTSHALKYNLLIGFSYLFKYKSFEFLPVLSAGHYLKLEPVRGELILKQEGSNLTREFYYEPKSAKHLFNVSGSFITKFNFKFGLGFHFIIDYCFSKPVIKYVIYEKEYITTISEIEYQRKINLSSLNCLLGVHYNFGFHSVKNISKIEKP